MEGIIKVTPEQLVSTADEFNSTNSQIQTLTQQMLSTVDSLKSAWTGEAAEAYNTKFHQLEDDMNKIHKKINEHVTDLKQIAENFSKAEIENTNTGNTLQGDVINY